MIPSLKSGLGVEPRVAKQWSAALSLAGLAAMLLALPASSLATGVEISLGARYGEDAIYADHKQFDGQELFLRVAPSIWRGVWRHLDVAFEFAGGRFRNGAYKANAVMAGPVLIWRLPERYWSLEAGTRLTWLSEHEIGDRDVGGLFQFTSHVGLAWHFTSQLAAAVRLQHTSNASTY